MIDLSPDGIIVRKLDGEITFWSRGAEALYGWTEQKAIGRQTHSLLQTRFPEPIEVITQQLKKTGRWSGELVHSTKDGRQVVVQSWWLAQFDSERNVTEIMESNVDITGRKQAEESLTESKIQAKLYLDLMGHDISNMHQIIMGQLELAQEVMDLEGRLEGDDREMIDTSARTLQRSAKLIQNIRNIQKLRSGEYKFECMDLGDVLGEAVDGYSKLPDRDISISYAPVHDFSVIANPLLKDIFLNLLDNAVKHCDDPVRIGVDVSCAGQNGKSVYRVAVEDNGRGVPDDKKAVIFNRLNRGDTKARGTGLGLYIVKTLVESFGGNVSVEDRVPGDHTKGARFVVMLPAVDK